MSYPKVSLQDNQQALQIITLMMGLYFAVSQQAQTQVEVISFKTQVTTDKHGAANS